MEASMENSIIEKRVIGNTAVFIGSDIIAQVLPRLRSVFEEVPRVLLARKENSQLEVLGFERMEYGV